MCKILPIYINYKEILFLISDNIPTGIWQYSILDDITAEWFQSLYNVPDLGHPNLSRGAVTWTFDRGCYIFTSKAKEFQDISI